ncbi:MULTISPECIES: S8/S53 family peptidase [unclassified Terrabacter]|uniref:S8 family peptidase n=1 Tax=unclassified Terrabacter TaxID=2630222 RepID=UPI000B1B4424|nr:MULTISPECIES: S8/S53 family peptidase [unclassified Terrabacter]
MAASWWTTAVPNPPQRDRYRAQIDKMITRFNGRVAPFPQVADLADAVFLHSTQHVLARDDGNLPQVLGALNLTPASVDRPVAGLARVRLDAGTTAPQAIQRVETAAGTRLAVFDRVVHIASASACPATEPEATASRSPVPPSNGKPVPLRAVHVAIIDTGLPPRAGGGTMSLDQWPWMQNVTGGPEDSSHAGHYKGHGLFVAGVLAAVARAATIKVHPFIFTNGGQLESDLVGLIAKAASENPRPDIISMSAGTSLHGPAIGVDTDPLLGFDALGQHLAQQGTLLVCAAGNDAGPGPFEPASLGWPVAVGALNADGSLAGYSNRGPWVDVYARGTDVVNAFKNGAYVYEEPPRAGGPALVVNNWLASWTGTSFATPIVAGAIANRMAVHNETAAVAWAAIKLAADQQAGAGGLPTIP